MRENNPAEYSIYSIRNQNFYPLFNINTIYVLFIKSHNNLKLHSFTFLIIDNSY